MADQTGAWEVKITEFLEDPRDDCALAVRFEVRGPNHEYEARAVYFEESFIEKYFKVPWFKDLSKESQRLRRQKRDLFFKWSLVKIERFLDGEYQDRKIIIGFDQDAEWAEKVQYGGIEPASVLQADGVYKYLPKRK